MSALALALTAAGGTALLLCPSRVSRDATGAAPIRHVPPGRTRRSLDAMGLRDNAPRELIAVVAVAGSIGALVGWAAFAGPLPAALIGGFSASTPLASARVRARSRRARALDAWPNLIQELRVRTGSLGRSIPQALFEVGASGPVELRPAFAAAHREWLLCTDLTRTLRVLRDGLGDATTDVVCETLLVAHDVGGSDLDQRLAALAEDRAEDRRCRKDATARLAGARFARRFVLLVPAGMALAGMAIGEGRSAYATPSGQLLVAAAITVLVGCWLWAGRAMRLPDEPRVHVS